MKFNGSLLFAVAAVVCSLQLTQTGATMQHAKEVLRCFRRVRVDGTKNAVYQSHVRHGIRTLLQRPLVEKAIWLKETVKLSPDCLHRMVDEARQHENKCYARFTYACAGHAAYSAECLHAALPDYYRRLRTLAAQTAKCWKL